jgi:iron complex outermembrane receptor protein
MRQIFIAAFMLVSAISAFGQHVIKGKVLDEKGNSLTGATVVVQNSSSGKTTDKNGSFLFDKLAKLHYTLKASFIGYETTTVQADVDKEIVLTLKSKSVSIDEITVTSLRASDKSPVAYTNIDKEALAKSNLGQDIPYLLAYTPSLVTTSDAGTGIGYTGLRIRGTDANRINMTLNGVPLNDAESHGVYFVDFPDIASSLSAVQIQRGVGTSTNGAAAFGASINMQTELLNSKPYAEISSTYGSFNTNKNSLKVGTGILSNHFAFDARLSNVTSDGYVDRASVDMKSYYLSAGYYSDKTIIKFITFSGNEKTYQAWNGVSGDSLKTNRTYNELGKYTDANGKTQFYKNQTDNYIQSNYQIHLLQEINPDLHFNSTLHYTKGAGYYEEYKEAQKYTDYNLTPVTLNGQTLDSTDLVRQKWLDNDYYGLTASLNYQTKKVNASIGGAASEYVGRHFGDVIWVRNANNLDVADQYYRSISYKDEANIYAKATAELIENLYGMVDMQYQIIRYNMQGTDDVIDPTTNTFRNITQSHPFDFFNPKIGLNYKLNKNSNVFASYSIANRDPNQTDYTNAGLDQTPTSERLYDTELGYRYQSPRINLGANLYYMRYRNQLILTGKISEIGEMLTSNIPDTYRSGLELTVGIKATDWLRWDGNLTLSSNKILNFTEEGVDVYDATGENWLGTQNNYLGTTDIAYSPNFIGNSIFTFNYKNFECGLQSNYVGKQYLDNTSDNSRAIHAYFVNNLSFQYSLKLKQLKSIDFKVLVNNLFNEQYETNGYTWYSSYQGGQRVNDLRYFPQAGINFLAGVTLKF